MVIVMAAAPSPFWISKANAPRQQASEDQYCDSQFMHAGLLYHVVHPPKMSADAWGNLRYAENVVLKDAALLPRGCDYCPATVALLPRGCGPYSPADVALLPYLLEGCA